MPSPSQLNRPLSQLWYLWYMLLLSMKPLK